MPPDCFIAAQLFALFVSTTQATALYQDYRLYLQAAQIQSRSEAVEDQQARSFAVQVQPLTDSTQPSPIGLLPRELCTKILLHLDYRSMCRMERVSKAWKSCAENSLVWRHALICYHPEFLPYLSYVSDREREICKMVLIEPDAELNCLDQLGKRWTIKINDRMTVFVAKILIAVEMKQQASPEQVNLYQQAYSFKNTHTLRQELDNCDPRKCCVDVSIVPK